MPKQTIIQFLAERNALGRIATPRQVDYLKEKLEGKNPKRERKIFKFETEQERKEARRLASRNSYYRKMQEKKKIQREKQFEREMERMFEKSFKKSYAN